MENIKIHIVEDNLMVLQSLKYLLSSIENFDVVATSINLEQALIDAKKLKPNIILMDVNMGSKTCYNCLEEILSVHKKTKVIALTSSEDISVIQKMLKIGANGYLTKSVSKKTLIKGINEVLNGKEFICEEVKDIYFKNFINDDFNEAIPESNVNDLRKRVDERINHILEYSEGVKTKDVS